MLPVAVFQLIVNQGILVDTLLRKIDVVSWEWSVSCKYVPVVACFCAMHSLSHYTFTCNINESSDHTCLLQRREVVYIEDVLTQQWNILTVIGYVNIWTETWGKHLAFVWWRNCLEENMLESQTPRDCKGRSQKKQNTSLF